MIPVAALLSDATQVALIRDLIHHARKVGAEHVTYDFGNGQGKPCGPKEHVWMLGQDRVIVHVGHLVYKRRQATLLTAREVETARQVADLLAAVGVLPLWFASAYQVGREDGGWIADVVSNPDRRCRRCGVRTGLKMLFSGIGYGTREWECRDGCAEVPR